MLLKKPVTAAEAELPVAMPTLTHNDFGEKC